MLTTSDILLPVRVMFYIKGFVFNWLRLLYSATSSFGACFMECVFMSSPPDIVGKGIRLSVHRVCSFIWTDLVTTISHEWLDLSR